MPRIAYAEKKLKQETLAVIAVANEIIEEFAEDGFDLTLRQLYYQFVARDLIANADSEYKRLGKIISDARLCGYLDWDNIVDRTRMLRAVPHWDSPKEILGDCARQFRIDKWASQQAYVEVWIEKDALVGVIEGVCQGLDVPYFSCRGYTSQSEMWRAGRRLREHVLAGQLPVVLHLGDHDPSGIDMTRDIRERLETFMCFSDDVLLVKRIGLNFDQVQEYGPPPNPAKLSDSRAREYVAKYGKDSWELDALRPQVIEDLIRQNVGAVLEMEKWNRDCAREELCRQQLHDLADGYEEAE